MVGYNETKKCAKHSNSALCLPHCERERELCRLSYELAPVTYTTRIIGAEWVVLEAKEAWWNYWAGWEAGVDDGRDEKGQLNLARLQVDTMRENRRVAGGGCRWPAYWSHGPIEEPKEKKHMHAHTQQQRRRPVLRKTASRICVSAMNVSFWMLRFFFVSGQLFCLVQHLLLN